MEKDVMPTGLVSRVFGDMSRVYRVARSESEFRAPKISRHGGAWQVF